MFQKSKENVRDVAAAKHHNTIPAAATRAPGDSRRAAADHNTSRMIEQQRPDGKAAEQAAAADAAAAAQEAKYDTMLSRLESYEELAHRAFKVPTLLPAVWGEADAKVWGAADTTFWGAADTKAAAGRQMAWYERWWYESQLVFTWRTSWSDNPAPSFGCGMFSSNADGRWGGPMHSLEVSRISRRCSEWQKGLHCMAVPRLATPDVPQ
jgi:hypothetical protein